MFNLAYGPLNKSIFTQELELVTKLILNKPDAVKLKIKENIDQKSHVHATIGNVELNLSNLFKKANFSHIEFNKTDSNLYLKQINQHFNNYEIQHYFAPHEIHNNKLTTAEIMAIQGYTGSDYYNINNLLYDKASQFSYLGQSGLKNVVLETMMLASGLNKIHPITEVDLPSYRGEKTPYHEILERIDVIDNGGGIIPTKAFNSTSLDPDVAKAFSVSSIIHFDGLYGKNVVDFSHFVGEQELLLPPSQIYWESYEIVNDTYIFHAKVVEPFVEGKDDPTANDLTTFNKLLDYAKNSGINADFITPSLLTHLSETQPNIVHHNKQPLDKFGIQPEHKTAPITLADCISDLKNDVISGLENLSLNDKNQTQVPQSEPLISLSEPIFQASVVIQELQPMIVDASII